MKTLERIIRDELMIRCNILIDQRQHDFLFGKSCGTQNSECIYFMITILKDFQ